MIPQRAMTLVALTYNSDTSTVPGLALDPHLHAQHDSCRSTGQDQSRAYTSHTVMLWLAYRRILIGIVLTDYDLTRTKARSPPLFLVQSRSLLLDPDAGGSVLPW